VPTMYYATPADTFRQAGISLVIWANHLVRASIAAMRDTASRIAKSESLLEVEGRVTSVREIFRLTGNDELEEATRRYLPATRSVRGIVLAASRGSDLGAETADRPKCMIDVRGKPLLNRLLSTLDECGIGDVAVVRGYRKETIPTAGITVVDNDAYADTGEASSLACALSRLQGETVVVYGDVLFRRYILEELLDSAADITVVVDSVHTSTANPRDLVSATIRNTGFYHDDEQPLLTGVAADPASATGQWIGLMYLSAQGSQIVHDELEAMRAEGVLDKADLPALMQRLSRRYPIAIHYITGHWLDVDTMADLAEARNFS
jgi:phosphoenolpyruvate phosphomutase